MGSLDCMCFDSWQEFREILSELGNLPWSSVERIWNMQNGFWAVFNVKSGAISFYVTLLVKYYCPFFISLVECILKPDRNWGPWWWEKRVGYVQAIVASIQFRIEHVHIYKSDIVPVILCRWEICHLKAREDHRWRACESKEVRRIFGVGGR
jgi:hypothetical protein